MQLDFTQPTYATSYGSGPFHPAIRNGQRLWFWPDTTYAAEGDAWAFAADMLRNAFRTHDAVAWSSVVQEVVR